jgi:16S rRNA (guanine527-N7)-methyltransferase
MPHSDNQLKIYFDLLLKWQKKINLISPITIDNAWERHFEDSKQMSQYIPDGIKEICDIGSGAGFPALILAILNPDIQFTLIESDARKCAFLNTVSRETKLDNVKIINDRIENAIPEMKADCVTARALASLRQLIDYSLPLIHNNKNLSMLLPKGKNWQDEINEAKTRYNFDYKNYQSVTDDQARILCVYNIVQN